jgi:hypothetical protein
MTFLKITIIVLCALSSTFKASDNSILSTSNSSQSKMSTHMLRLFNPFTLQSGSNQLGHRMTQEVVYYAESRFRHILLYIDERNLADGKWIQVALRSELVYIYFILVILIMFIDLSPDVCIVIYWSRRRCLSSH